MPHCIIEYAKTLEQHISPQQLMDATNQGAINSELFDIEDIKCRTIYFDNFQVGNSDKSFIHITAKILNGRNDQQKAKLSSCILEELLKFGLSSVSLTVEISDIYKDVYAKKVL